MKLLIWCFIRMMGTWYAEDRNRLPDVNKSTYMLPETVILGTLQELNPVHANNS